MKKFMDEDFLLNTPTAQKLYHDYAANMPIIDYHCHVNPADIANDTRYSTITEVWLGGDHYKWRLMRASGVSEDEITTNQKENPYCTFQRWAETVPRIIGNPVYHWTHLELKRYFGINECLTPKTCKDIYDRCNQLLQEPSMSVRGIIQKSNVKVICTTDDLVDDLRYHQQIKDDSTFDVKVLPALRPDKAMNVDKPEFAGYLSQLEQVVGYEINTFADIKKAVMERIDFFQSMGCRVSDHALEKPIFETATQQELDAILQLGKKGEAISKYQGDQFRTAFLMMVAEKYYENDWSMQIHYGCIRNLNTKMFEKMGPDTGFDAINDCGGAAALAAMLDAMQQCGKLPKIILYSLNQYDNDIICSIAGCFQENSSCRSKIQIGAAWWFNDHLPGMKKMMTDLASMGVLGNFIGMLTDSRSFLSYTRHEYFRRLLCNILGNWVENGEYPNDLETLGQLVQDVCYNNAARYFGM